MSNENIVCCYCSDYGKIHVDGADIMRVIDELSNEKRAIVVNFIAQIQNPNTYHTTHAEDLVKRVCQYCGEDKEREDDGDRYYWICENNTCQPHN